MMDIVGNLGTIGAFTLASVIAFVGICQSRKKDIDRVYECLEIMTNSKMELEFALASFAETPDNREVFNNLNTRYTAFVNNLDSFSAKILNQKLHKTATFKDFQGESLNGLKDWAVIQLDIFELINDVSFNVFEITSAETTRKSYLKNTYKLLKITLPSEDYNDLLNLCKKREFF